MHFGEEQTTVQALHMLVIRCIGVQCATVITDLYKKVKLEKVN